MYYVDLPGYGYAKASASAVEQWGKMIENYLHRSRNLKAVLLLVDIRHEPKANDRQMYDWIISRGYTPIVIATKSDKINRSQIAKNIKIIREGLNAPKDITIIPFSAESKSGREEIWDIITDIIEKGSAASAGDTPSMEQI